jgi:hypothetical protein
MQQTIEEIKQQHPDEWLILGDPVMSKDEQQVLAAELLYHSSDQRELVKMDKPLMKNYKHFATFFNRVTPRKVSYLIGTRTLYSTPVSRSNEPVVPLRSIYQ